VRLPHEALRHKSHLHALRNYKFTHHAEKLNLTNLHREMFMRSLKGSISRNKFLWIRHLIIASLFSPLHLVSQTTCHIFCFLVNLIKMEFALKRWVAAFLRFIEQLIFYSARTVLCLMSHRWILPINIRERFFTSIQQHRWNDLVISSEIWKTFGVFFRSACAIYSPRSHV
jgi:hypothetical protein